MQTADASWLTCKEEKHPKEIKSNEDNSQRETCNTSIQNIYMNIIH